ncbi:MAG: acyloxyacyl hydrolase [Candidatus Cryptobacteroides sp.]|nr:acyloxyacyl hydrolase [Candidatus Cryptobacteroides sp.]
MNRWISSVAFLLVSVAVSFAGEPVPKGFSRPLEWRIGAQVTPAWVPATNDFLKGENQDGRRVGTGLSGALRADFSFSPGTREGLLYKGLYQGVGISANSLFSNELLGTPVSLYLYQGAPIVHFNEALRLGYEWQFGAAFGWKPYGGTNEGEDAPVSTSVTAHIGLGLKLDYALSDRWTMSFGVRANHFSNGNTSWPNAGVNSIGAEIGLSYVVSPAREVSVEPVVCQEIVEAADRRGWFYDIMVFGAWRKRAVYLGEPVEPKICPGRFGVLGLQFSPMYRINRFVAAGPALDMQWDEGAGLAPYWVEGTDGDNIKFARPPFGKQLSAGLSAHAELTMPIFSVNAGLGYDIVNPKGNKRFYQSLTLKTFLTKYLYINVGYRLGEFRDPQNLMLGLGVRL